MVVPKKKKFQCDQHGRFDSEKCPYFLMGTRTSSPNRTQRIVLVVKIFSSLPKNKKTTEVKMAVPKKKKFQCNQHGRFNTKKCAYFFERTRTSSKLASKFVSLFWAGSRREKTFFLSLPAGYLGQFLHFRRPYFSCCTWKSLITVILTSIRTTEKHEFAIFHSLFFLG
jgi:hypothetical protein